MTVQEIVDGLDTFTDGERVKYINPLTEMFSSVSISSLQEFQRKWDGDRTFAEFMKAQNEVIRECVKCEVSQSIGDVVRSIQGLKPLKMSTEVVAN